MAVTIPAQPNPVPQFPSSPTAIGPLALPATAKTVLNDTSNATLVPLFGATTSFASNTVEIDSLYVEVTATLVAGKLLAVLYNGTTAYEVGNVPHGAITISTTAGVPPLAFAFSPNNPLIIPPGYTLYLASAVAQTAGALIGFGFGKIY